MSGVRTLPSKYNSFVKHIGCSPKWSAWVLNAVFAILILVFCDLKYEVSDDFVMSSILSGAYGGAVNPHIIFSNIMIGYFLAPFYWVFPQVSWYFVFQLTMVFLSSTAATFLVFRRLKSWKAITLAVLLLAFFTSDAYILVQFTKTAMFATMAGSVLFLDELFTAQQRKILVAGAGLCLCGTLIRFADIYICGGFLLFILFYEFIALFVQKKQNGNSSRDTKLVPILLSGTVLICIAFGLNELDRYIYSQNSDYAYFREYSKARSEIVDYPDYGYPEELSNLGISENDYYMMKSWSFEDENIFSLETMQEVSRIIKKQYDNRSVSLFGLWNSVRARGLSHYPIFWCCFILLILGFIFFPNRWWAFGGCAGIGLAYFLYFAFRERSLYRIEFSILLGIFLCGMYFMRETSEKNLSYILLDKVQYTFCTVVFVGSITWCAALFLPDISYQTVTSETRQQYINDVFYQSWNFDSRKYRTNVNRGKPENKLLSEIRNHPQNFYFLDFNTTIQTLYFEYSPWETLPMNYFNNHLHLGGVTTAFPDVMHILEERQVTNPLKNLINDDVYLIDNYYPERKLTFLKAHYYPNARIELYKEIDGYQIWKVYRE